MSLDFNKAAPFQEQMRQDFLVPQMIGHVLSGCDILDEVMEYTIHAMLGDLKPDCGMLAISLCAMELASHYKDSPMAQTLSLQAQRIIHEYGPLWIAHSQDNNSALDQTVRAKLIHIPEDLETLADLFDSTNNELAEDNYIARTLCDMLSLQARVHAEAAEVELYVIKLMPIPRAATIENNIVPFPVRA
jgi:hypothetical protein